MEVKKLKEKNKSMQEKILILSLYSLRASHLGANKTDSSWDFRISM